MRGYGSRERWTADPRLPAGKGIRGRGGPRAGKVENEVVAALDDSDKDAGVAGAGLAANGDRPWPRRQAAIFRHPVVPGAGTPFLPPVTQTIPLDLVRTRTIGSRMIFAPSTSGADERRLLVAVTE